MQGNLHPPKLAEKLLSRLCKDELLEEIMGDLYQYHHDLAHLPGWKQRLYYWFHVFNFLRPFALKNSRIKNSNIYDMYKNYFKIGYRNLLRNKGYSMINIGGLALGLTIAMLIGLWVYDELSYDTFHANYDKIGRARQHVTLNGQVDVGPAVSMPVGPTIRAEHGEDVEALAYASWSMDYNLTFGDKTIKTMGNYMGKESIRMFTLPMIKGSEDALEQPNSIILNASLARSIFGDEDPMNKVLRIDNNLNVQVTGIFEDLPHNSTFGHLTFIAPWELYVSDQLWVQNAIKEQNWGNNSFQLFLQMADHVTIEAFNQKIETMMHDHIDEGHRAYQPKIVIYPMRDWHLRSSWVNGVQSGGAIQYVWLFGTIGFFVLMLACINFMNLSTAQAEKRAREVGIRKTMGSLRHQLVGQFLSESFLTVLLAFALANALVFLAIPYFNQLADKQVTLPLNEPLFWAVSVLILTLTALIAGSYPAFYLSSFKPVGILRGTIKAGKSSAWFRKGLVITQFSVSVMLIIGSLMVRKQIEFTKERPIGYDNSGTIMVYQGTPDFEGKFELLRTALKSNGAITEMAESDSPLTGVWSNSSNFSWEGKDPSFQTNFATIRVSRSFGETIGWRIKEGRTFSFDYATDSAAVILNEAAVKYMNIQDPVGKLITWENNADFRIVGVVDNILMESPFQEIRPTLYYINEGDVYAWLQLKLNPDKSLANSLALTEEVFREVMPAVPFDYKFADQEHAWKFAYEERIGKIAGIFAVFAVLISCLGLFGLSSYVAEQRTKEIGVRKVLGASVWQLWQMMSREFVFLVGIACMVALPLAYYFVDNWLDNYAYRTAISWWVLAGSIVLALLTTLLTVSYQSITAARMNPTESLRSE